MSRPRREAPERYVARQVKFPPNLWAEVERRVPSRERSLFIRNAVKAALLQRAAEQLVSYYADDPEARVWAEFPGDEADEQG